MKTLFVAISAMCLSLMSAASLPAHAATDTTAPVDPQATAYGGKGDTRSFAAGCSATGRLVSCANASFTADDIGKVILIHGAGSNGAAFQSHIRAVADPSHISMEESSAKAVSDAAWAYGTDDTAAFASALADAIARHKPLHVPSGAYWLASQTRPMPLTAVAMACDAVTTAIYTPYTASGCTLLLDNMQSQVFATGHGFAVHGFTFYWPRQDGSGPAPIPYKPLFENGSMVNAIFEDNTVVNAMDTFTMDADGGGGVGRLQLRGNRIYSIHFDFDFHSGIQDVLSIDGSNYFGVGAYGDIGPTGAAMLNRFTTAHGEHIHADIGAGHYPNLDGLMLTSYIVQQKHDFIHLVSGMIDVSNISNINLDSVQRMLAVEGSASVVSTSWSGGEVYSSDPFDTADKTPANVVDLDTSGSVEMSVSGLFVAFALGDIYRDNGSGHRNISWAGGILKAWGRSKRSGTYFAFVTAKNANSIMTLGGALLIAASPALGNRATGVRTNDNALTDIGHVVFANTYVPIEIAGSIGINKIIGATSIATTGPVSIDNVTTGAKTFEGGNAFDRPGWSTTGFRAAN